MHRTDQTEVTGNKLLCMRHDTASDQTHILSLCHPTTWPHQDVHACGMHKVGMTRRGLNKISDGGRDLQPTVVDLWGVSPPSMNAARGVRCVKAQTRASMDVFCCTV